MRVAANGTGGTFHIEVNGIDKTGPVTIPNTGGWQQWQTLTKTGVSLNAGVQVLRVVLDTNGPINFVGNLNYIDLTSELTSNAPPTVSLTSPAAGTTFTPPATITLTATASDSDGTVSKVEFYTGATLIGTATTAPYSITWSSVVAGAYTDRQGDG
jgi:hypothetical protein